MELITSLNYVDYLIVIIALISGVMAMMRGLTREILGLIGWVLAVIIARLLDDITGRWLQNYIDSTTTANALGWIIPFCVAGLAVFILSNMFAPGLSRTAIGLLDKPLGFLFGLARGLVIVALLYIGTVLTINQEDGLPQDVLSASMIEPVRRTAVAIAGLLPETVYDEIIAKVPANSGNFEGIDDLPDLIPDDLPDLIPDDLPDLIPIIPLDEDNTLLPDENDLDLLPNILDGDT